MDLDRYRHNYGCEIWYDKVRVFLGNANMSRFVRVISVSRLICKNGELSRQLSVNVWKWWRLASRFGYNFWNDTIAMYYFSVHVLIFSKQLFKQLLNDFCACLDGMNHTRKNEMRVKKAIRLSAVCLSWSLFVSSDRII